MVQSAGIMYLSIYFQAIKYKMFASYSNPYAKINEKSNLYVVNCWFELQNLSVYFGYSLFVNHFPVSNFHKMRIFVRFFNVSVNYSKI